MVRWHNSGDNNATITFVWDRTGDALYETALLAITGTTAGNLEVVDDIRVENPCKDVDDAESADEGRYVSVGSATSQNLVTTAPGTIMGLCVREEGTSRSVLRLGHQPGGGAQHRHYSGTWDENKTVELTWTDVDLKADFDYELHLAKDPERPTTDNKIGTSAATSGPCRPLRQRSGDRCVTPDINLDDRSVSVESLDPYAGISALHPGFQRGRYRGLGGADRGRCGQRLWK